MTEWRRFSRLPESADYWRELRDRIGYTAQAELARHSRRGRWMDVSLFTAASAMAAAVVFLLTRPAETPARAELLMGLAPSDPAAVELLRSDEAPSVGVLLPTFARRETR